MNPEQLVQCMQVHSSDLAPTCRAFVQNATDRFKSLHDGCDADMATYCPDIPSFGRELKKCAMSHLADLSKPCLSAISGLMAEKWAHHLHRGDGMLGPWGGGGGDNDSFGGGGGDFGGGGSSGSW